MNNIKEEKNNQLISISRYKNNFPTVNHIMGGGRIMRRLQMNYCHSDQIKIFCCFCGMYLYCIDFFIFLSLLVARDVTAFFLNKGIWFAKNIE